MDDAILEQNRLLKEQNELLRRTLNSSQAFVKDLYTDEMRAGYLVTSHRKKLWNVQIGLINEFARVCRKYDLRWFAYGGTLLGAVRHKGFIPWDDDVDLCMLRPDYNKFVEVAANEISDPYFLDLWQNYRWESKGYIDAPDEQQFPLISIEQERTHPHHWPRFPFLKIRDNRTTLIEFQDRPNFNQGVWIDVMCLDSVPPFSEQKRIINFEAAKELFLTATFPHQITDGIMNGVNYVIDRGSLESVLKMTFRQRAIRLEQFLLEAFFESQKVGDFAEALMNGKTGFFDLKDYDDIVYQPFEKIELPVPVGYENLLRTQYGDWHRMVITHSHAQDYSADIPYKQYIRQSALMR